MVISKIIKRRTMVDAILSFFLLLQCSILSGEAAHTNLKVACLNQTVLDPMIYHTRGEPANYHTIDQPGLNSGRGSSSWSTSGTHSVNLVTNPVISHEWGKDREVFMTSGTYQTNYHTIDLFIMHITEIHRTVEWCPFAFWVNKSCRINSPVTYGGSYCLIRKSKKNMAKRKSTNGQTKHTHTIKDRVTRTSLKTGAELRKGKQFLIH
jgi:hypothetical protein